MSELPDDLRALLNLAKDGHDPTDPRAQGRVRHAIAASLLLSSGTAASSSVFPEAAASKTLTVAQGAKATKAAWVLFGSKLTTLAAGTAAVVGLSLAAYHYAPRSAPVQSAFSASSSAQPAAIPSASARRDDPVPSVEPLVPAAATDDLSARGSAADDRRDAAKLHKTRASAEDLSAEMALVRTASDALARGDESAALAALREHAHRFASGSLRVERDGLRAIAECSRETGPSNASAKRFLRMYPHSLLSARVTKACAVE